MNREQSVVIDYIKEENRVLRELLGKKRLRLNNDQRRRLAAQGKTLGRRLLSTCCSIVTPDTILRWHRQLTPRSTTVAPTVSPVGHGSLTVSDASRTEWPRKTERGVIDESKAHWLIWTSVYAQPRSSGS